MDEQEFPYILIQDKPGRKGAACKKLRTSGNRAQIQFEDGSTLVVSVMGLRRKDAPAPAALGNGKRKPYGKRNYLG